MNNRLYTELRSEVGRLLVGAVSSLVVGVRWHGVCGRSARLGSWMKKRAGCGIAPVYIPWRRTE